MGEPSVAVAAMPSHDWCVDMGGMLPEVKSRSEKFHQISGGSSQTYSCSATPPVSGSRRPASAPAAGRQNDSLFTRWPVAGENDIRQPPGSSTYGSISWHPP